MKSNLSQNKRGSTRLALPGLGKGRSLLLFCDLPIIKGSLSKARLPLLSQKSECEIEMPLILDFAFDRLGANQQMDLGLICFIRVIHGLARMNRAQEFLGNKLCYYSLIAFGVGAAFSYKYNQQRGICEEDGPAVCPGFTTTHIIPFVDGEPFYKGCCQTNIGGYHVTDNLKQLLSLKYPHHIFTWEKVEDLKMEHCYISPDYALEARLFQKVESTLMKVSSLRKAKGESKAEQAENEEKADSSTSEKENPEVYLEQMHTKYKELYEKVEQRKRLKTNGNNLLGSVGHGERLNAAQREDWGVDRGKGEDTFGAKDEDWQLYKLMSKDNDDGADNFFKMAQMGNRSSSNSMQIIYLKKNERIYEMIS
ncbi:hypothetical protein CRYUN_Cryun09bG0099400 [Craigia yunnanensis]